MSDKWPGWPGGKVGGGGKLGQFGQRSQDGQGGHLVIRDRLLPTYLISENTREVAVYWSAGPITCLSFVDVYHIIIPILQKFGAKKAQHVVWRDSNVLQLKQVSYYKR